MDKEKMTITAYQEQIQEAFENAADEKVYAAWADTFSIESVDEKRVVVCYYGTKDMQLFKTVCRKPLLAAIYAVAGPGKNVKVIKRRKRSKPQRAERPQRAARVTHTEDTEPPVHAEKKKALQAFKFFVIGMVFVCIAAAMLVVMCSYVGNRNFTETFYNASSIKVDSRIRVVQLSDMHCATYGKDNQALLDRVAALDPDVILCTGDMVESATTDVTYMVTLAQGLSNIAPAYYVYGNNEVETIYDVLLNEQDLDKKFGFNSTNRDETALLQLPDAFEEALEKAGMKVLKNEKDTIKVGTTQVDIYGVLTSNPSAFWSYSGKAFESYIYEDTDSLKITAVHEPFIFQTFHPEYWGDLLVCGHTHGGIARIPVLGPLYTKEGGLLPERSGDFVYGRYDVSGAPLIVSAGLENASVFRINNQPELVVIDVNKF